MTRPLFAVCLIFLSCPQVVSADTLELEDGTVLEGTILDQGEEEYIIESGSWAHNVPVSQIVAINGVATREPAVSELVPEEEVKPLMEETPVGAPIEEPVVVPAPPPVPVPEPVTVTKPESHAPFAVIRKEIQTEEPAVKESKTSLYLAAALIGAGLGLFIFLFLFRSRS